MMNIINCSCARYSDISTITHSAKYHLIIVIDKIQKYRTPPVIDALMMMLYLTQLKH